MKRTYKKSLAIILLFLLSLTINFTSLDSEEITVLFTHDLHDHFLPFDLVIDGKVVSTGGYARLKTAIDQEVSSKSNTIILDAGDYSMGTLFQTIFTDESPQLRVLGALGYDVVTLGNHEYDFRADGLSKSLNSAKISGDRLPEIVQANVSFPEEEDKSKGSLALLKEAMQSYPVKDYTIIDKSGIRIGIFGLTGEDSASKAPMAGVDFTDPIKKAKEIVKILKEKEKVDLIVCISHSGTDKDIKKSEDEILASRVDGIDLIISGHSHTTLRKPIVVNSTLIASSGEYGKFLGTLTLSKADNNWTLKNYELKAIDESYPEDPEIRKLIDGYKAKVQKNYLDNFSLEFDQLLGRLPFNFTEDDLFGKTHGEDTLGNFISDSYIYAVKEFEGDKYKNIDVAIVPSGTIRGSFVAGDMTVSDVFNVSSLGVGADGISGYPIISVYLYGSELKTACEVDASISPIMTDAQLYMSGLNFSFNPNRMFLNKVTDAYLEDSEGKRIEIDDDKLYRVVVGLYSAQMLSAVESKSKGLLSIVPKDEYGNTIQDFEDYIVKGSDDSELKEWLAIALYAKSFQENDETSLIPSYYNSLQGRKVVNDDKNIIEIFDNPSPLAIKIYIFGASILAIIFLIIYKFTTRKK